MTATPEYFASLLVLTGVASAVVGAPLAAATPPVSGQSASDVIRELEDQGYNVGINWVNGNTTAQLSECAVSAVHNPDSGPPPPATFTTVYVDVVCPNNDDPGGISVGAGIG
jgi:hypothetical protein